MDAPTPANLLHRDAARNHQRQCHRRIAEIAATGIISTYLLGYLEEGGISVSSVYACYFRVGDHPTGTQKVLHSSSVSACPVVADRDQNFETQVIG